MNAGNNITATETELRQIRALDDFDLTMLLSEINDHGWKTARTLLELIGQANTESDQPKTGGAA